MPRTKQRSNSVELTTAEEQSFRYVSSPANLASAKIPFFVEFQRRSFVAEPGNNVDDSELKLDIQRGRVCFADAEDKQSVDDFFADHKELQATLIQKYSQAPLQLLVRLIGDFFFENSFQLINQNQNESKDRVIFKIVDDELFAEVTYHAVTMRKFDDQEITTIPGQAKTKFKFVTTKLTVDSVAVTSESFIEDELVQIGNLVGLQKNNDETKTAFAQRVKKYFEHNKNKKVDYELQGFQLVDVASTTPELDKIFKGDVTVFESLHRIAQKKAAWLNQCCLDFNPENELFSIAQNVDVDCSSYLDESINQAFITNYQKAHAAFLAAEEDAFIKAKDELMLAYGALMLDFGKWLRKQREDVISKNGTFFIAGEDIPGLKNKLKTQLTELAKSTLVIDKKWLDENGYKPQSEGYGDNGKLINGFVKDYPRRIENGSWVFAQDDTVINADVSFENAESFIDSLHCDDDVKRCVTYFIYQSGIVGTLNALLINLLLDFSGKMPAIDLNDHRILLRFLSKDKFSAEVNVSAYLSILDKNEGIKKLVVNINAQLQVDCSNHVDPQVTISSLNFAATKKPNASILYKFLSGALTLDKSQVGDTDLLVPYALDIAAIFEASSRNKLNYEKLFKEGLHTYNAFDWFEVREKDDELSRKANAVFEKVYSTNPATIDSWLKAASELSELAVDCDSNSPRRAALVNVVNGMVAELRKICVAHNEISILTTIDMHRFELHEHRKWLMQRCMQLDPNLELVKLAENVGVDFSQYKDKQDLFAKYRQAFAAFLKGSSPSLDDRLPTEEQKNLIWHYYILRKHFNRWLTSKCRDGFASRNGLFFVTEKNATFLKERLENDFKQLAMRVFNKDEAWLKEKGYPDDLNWQFNLDHAQRGKRITRVFNQSPISLNDSSSEDSLSNWKVSEDLKTLLQYCISQCGLENQIQKLLGSLFRGPAGIPLTFTLNNRKIHISLYSTGFTYKLEVIDRPVYFESNDFSVVPQVVAEFRVSFCCKNPAKPAVKAAFKISTAKPINADFVFRITNEALEPAQVNIEDTDLLIPYTLQLAKVFSATPDRLAKYQSSYEKAGFYIEAPLELNELKKNPNDPLNIKVKNILEKLYKDKVITEKKWIAIAWEMVAVAKEKSDSRHFALQEIGYGILRDIVEVKKKNGLIQQVDSKLIVEIETVDALDKFIQSPAIKVQKQLSKVLNKPLFVSWLKEHWQNPANRIIDIDSFLENLYVQLAQADTPSLVRRALGQCFFPNHEELQEELDKHSEDISLPDHTIAHESLVAEACDYLHHKYKTVEQVNDERVKFAIKSHERSRELQKIVEERSASQEAKEEYRQQKRLGYELMRKINLELEYLENKKNKTAYDALLRAKMALQWMRDVWVEVFVSLSEVQDSALSKIQTGYKNLITEANKILVNVNESLTRLAAVKAEEQTTCGLAEKSFYCNLINYHPETYAVDIEREKNNAANRIIKDELRIAAASEIQPLPVEKIVEQLPQLKVGQTVVLAAAVAQPTDQTHEINLLTTVTHKKEEENEWYWVCSEDRPSKPGFFASSAEKQQYEIALRLNAVVIVYWSNKLAAENKDSSIMIKERDPQYVADLLMAIEAIRLRYEKEGKRSDFKVTHKIPKADLAEKALGKAKSFYKKHYADLVKPLVVAEEIEKLAKRLGYVPRASR